MYQRLLERRIAGRLWSLAAGAVLMTAACATTPPSLARASLSAMPADVDVAVAVHVAALRAPLTEVVRAADLPLPEWLLERLVVVVAGVYGGAEPGYLFWMRGVAMDPGMGAQLLLSPDWFYVERPYPHYRSDDAAVVLLGRDSLVMTNLPLGRVQRAFDAEEFELPADVTIAQHPLDILLVIPDLDRSDRRAGRRFPVERADRVVPRPSSRGWPAPRSATGSGSPARSTPRTRAWRGCWRRRPAAVRRWPAFDCRPTAPGSGSTA